MRRALCAGLRRLAAPAVALSLVSTTTPANGAFFNPASFMLSNGLQVVVISNHRAPIAIQMVWYGLAPPTRRLANPALPTFWSI